jgi:hypothetical protein
MTSLNDTSRPHENAARMTTQTIAGRWEAATAAAGGDFIAA